MTLERFVARLRNRVEDRLWKRLGRGLTDEQRIRLEDLLTVPPQARNSWLDKLRSGPVHVSGYALVHAIQPLQTVRDLVSGCQRPAFTFHCALNPMISYSMYGSDFTSEYPSKDCSVDMLIKIGCPKPPEEFLLRNIQF